MIEQIINIAWWFHLMLVGTSIYFVYAVHKHETKGPLTTREKIKYFLGMLFVLYFLIFLTVFYSEYII